jgi:hypothetical protein
MQLFDLNAKILDQHVQVNIVIVDTIVDHRQKSVGNHGTMIAYHMIEIVFKNILFINIILNTDAMNS